MRARTLYGRTRERQQECRPATSASDSYLSGQDKPAHEPSSRGVQPRPSDNRHSGASATDERRTRAGPRRKTSIEHLGPAQGEGASTMFGHFRDLLMATPTDGASAVAGSSPSRTLEDVYELMEAWHR